MTGIPPTVELLILDRRKQQALALVLLSWAMVIQVYGQAVKPSPHNYSSSSGGRVIEIDTAKALIPDVKVLTHDGRQVRLYSDLIKDKVVLLSFFYTSCTYICRMQGESLSKVQARLGEHLGKDVFLISISMDSKTDTPQKLKYWSRAVGARPGWTLISSNTPEMNKMIKDFTGNNPGPKDLHSSVVFVGNDRTGKWEATDGLGGTGGLVELLEGLAQ